MPTNVRIKEIKIDYVGIKIGSVVYHNFDLEFDKLQTQMEV